MTAMLQRIPIRFTVLLMGTLFFYNPLYGQCGAGYVEIDEECYWKKDIFFLQGFIDGSKDFLDIDMDDNEDGIISPLELGVQTWSGEGRLTSLFCSNRGLTGDIPEAIINLDKLYWLLLSDNQITGAIPENIGNLVNLIKLDLQWNEIEGNIPKSIEKLSMLQHLDLSFNQLTGSIPDGIGNLTNLKKLLLSDNQLTGSIPDGIGNFTNVEKLLLNTNQLEGVIPNSLCELNLDWGARSSVNLANNNFCPQYPVCVEFVMGDQDTSACKDWRDMQAALLIAEAETIAEAEAKETGTKQTTASALDVAEEAEQLTKFNEMRREEAEQVADEARNVKEVAEQAAAVAEQAAAETKAAGGRAREEAGEKAFAAEAARSKQLQQQQQPQPQPQQQQQHQHQQ